VRSKRTRANFLGQGLGRLFEPRELNSGAFDLTSQRHRLAEQARSIVGAAGELAREHRLGLGESGPEHELGRREDLLGRGGIAGLLQQKIDVGTKYVRE
jgi:hypothetical protein